MYKEPKYRTIEEASKEELMALKNRAMGDFYKPTFHIHPEYGLLNDPNGLAYYKGKYHVFHQWYPFGVTHGMKHWMQLESDDLVQFQRKGVALSPTNEYESHGAYSGTAIEVNGKLFLYYTGNIKYDKVKRSANQCLAIMDESFQVTKYDKNPIIRGTEEGYTGHVRDPKVFYKNGMYYMLLGAQRQNETGAIIMYQSKDGLCWEFTGELTIEGFDHNEAYMWECPDYVEIDGVDVLIFSPQGMKKEKEKYNNIFTVVTLIGKLDLERQIFTTKQYEEMDAGFDFYAPQTMKGKDGEILMFGWAGMGEFTYPTNESGWAHCLTCPRELRIRKNQLIQLPAKQLQAMRSEAVMQSGRTKEWSIKTGTHSFELIVSVTKMAGNTVTIHLFQSEEERVTITFDKEQKLVSLDRGQMVNQFVTEYGTVRRAYVAEDEEIKFQILSDQSIIELFVNDGEKVFTSRVFPQKESMGIEILSEDEMDCKLEYYKLQL